MKRFSPYITLVLIPSLGVFNPAAAEETTDSKWSSSAELGILVTEGNTETKSINAKANLGYEIKRWKHGLNLEAHNSSDDNGTTAERYFGSAKSDFNIDERSYLFITAQYEDDRFSGYEYQASEFLGYGYHFLKRSDLTVSGEAAPGLRQWKETGDESDDEFVARAAGHLKWTISDTSSFTQDLLYDYGDEFSVVKSISALSAQISGKLAMKISYTTKYTSDVPEGSAKRDSETAVTLVYTFL